MYKSFKRYIVLSILDSKRRIFANKENFGKENSLQRKGCKESKEKYWQKIPNFALISKKNCHYYKKISNLKIFDKIVA